MSGFLSTSFLVGLLKSKNKSINLVNAAMMAKEANVILESTKCQALSQPVMLNNGIKILICDINGSIKHTLIGKSYSNDNFCGLENIVVEKKK